MQDSEQESITLIGFALDKSGSMGSRVGLWSAALSGTNEFVQSQDPAINTTLPSTKTLFGMVLFDTVVQWRTSAPAPTYSFVEINEFVPLTEAHFRPYGMTALYDSIMTLINGVDAYIKDHPEQHISVIIVIQTDGEENSSKTTQEALRLTITDRTTSGWKFTFLGADQDACFAATRIGIDRISSLCYSNDAKHTHGVMSTLADAVSRQRSLPKHMQSQVQISYTEEERTQHVSEPLTP
jgi:hypothetical protein